MCLHATHSQTTYSSRFCWNSKIFMYYMYQELNVWAGWNEIWNAVYGANSVKPPCLYMHALEILELFTRKNWTDTCNSGHITKWFTSSVHTHTYTFRMSYLPVCTKPSSFRKVFRLRTYVNCIKGKEKRKIIKLYLPIITCLPFTFLSSSSSFLSVWMSITLGINWKLIVYNQKQPEVPQERAINTHTQCLWMRAFAHPIKQDIQLDYACWLWV